MGDGQEQDQYEERLKELFHSFDASGCGSLSPEELSDLCRSLHLHDETPALLQALLQDQDQDRLTARVDFDRFKHALILVLSSSFEQPEAEQETPQKPESPEIQPKFVKGSKRYGRRSTPEFIECAPEEAAGGNAAGEEDLEDSYDSAVPRKRERWNAYKTETEEYEAEGQMHLWNPDEPSTPRGSGGPQAARLEERLRDACEELDIAWDGCAGHSELLALCERLGLEVNGDALLSPSGDGAVNVQDFVSRVVAHNKPPTPSASTPYRQLKRLHSTQPFDEGGRRIATPASLTSSIGMRLFSTLDDGSGFTPAERILDAWIDEGIENSAEILQALNFDLDGKLSLGDLTVALENELLVTKNGIHQAALASFKAEIRHLLECVDREIREKDKIRTDLEKAERLKTQFAAEVDEHHSAIEHMNNLNLRKLEQEHREKLAAMRSELTREMDLMQQQAALQREELEAEVRKVREDESFLRDHLSISVKENRRLEMELLDSAEKLDEAQNHISKLQTNLDKIMKDKFGDLDPGSADFLLQEERIKQLRGGYEAQCRELQDRIDELQSELQEFHSLGRVHQPCGKPLSEELESKSPGMESDPGIGSEEVQPFSMSLEAEMMLEQLKEQHLQEMEDLRNQLENKISEFDKMVEKQRASHEDQKVALTLKYQQDVEALQVEMAGAQSHAQELQGRLDRAEQERGRLERRQAEEREELENLQEEEVGNLQQQLLEAHSYTADLEEQLKALEEETGGDLHAEMEELRTRHAAEIGRLKEEQAELLEARLAEERKELREEKVRSERSLLDGWEEEKKLLQGSHEETLEEAKSRFEEEREEAVRRLTEQWQEERARLDEQNNESLQALLEDEMLRLVREQEEKEAGLKEQWQEERVRLREQQEEALLDRLGEERRREEKLREEWERERLQLEEDYEGMIQDRLSEEREKLRAEREEEEARAERLIAEEKERLQESHREAVRELRAKHGEEREALSAALDKLRDDIAQERKEIQISFDRKIREVEDRFSADQETAAERFQADALQLERRYQAELESLSESHEARRLDWEAQMEKAAGSLEEQRRATEEERERLARELEGAHGEETEALAAENRRLRVELDLMVSEAQTKEIELSRQLNELHGRLQESLNANHQLLSQSEHKALRLELLLNQTVEDFERERAELEARRGEALAERAELLSERDGLRAKMEELEALLKQAAVDFEQERRELQENLSTLQKTLEERAERDALATRVEEMEARLGEAANDTEDVETQTDAESIVRENLEEVEERKELQENQSLLEELLKEVEDRRAERDALKIRVEELEMQLNQATNSAEKVEEEDLTGSNEVERMQSTEEEEDGAKQTQFEDDVDDCSSAGEDQEEQTDRQKEKETRDSHSENVPLVEDSFPETEDLSHEVCGCHDPESHPSAENKSEVFLEEAKPRDRGSSSREDELSHETCDLDGPEVDSHERRQELVLKPESSTTGIKREHAHDCAEAGDKESSLLELQTLCESAADENFLLHEKISLLQQKTEILEHLLAHSSQKVKTCQQVLEENYSLKVKMLLLMEHAQELEMKALKMTDLQIRYEDCVCENAKLKDQNAELEKRVWILEGGMNLFPDFRDQQQLSLAEEISRMKAENRKLSQMYEELEREEEEVEEEEEAVSDLEGCCLEFEKHNSKLRRAITDLQDESQTLNEATQTHRSEASRLAEENVVLRQKIAALKSEDLKEVQEELTQTLEHLNKEKVAARKATETFKKQISELRLQKQRLQDENRRLTEKNSQNVADVGKLRRQLTELTEEKSQAGEAFPAEERNKMAACVSALEAELTKALEDTAQLEDRNVRLSQELSESREKALRLDSVEVQLGHLVEERKSLDQETFGLRNELAKAQEKVKTSDDTAQVVNRQGARLKSDLRLMQQEKDSLKHEVAVLHKQLQNANDKNHVLEMALHSSGLQSHSKKLYRDEMWRLREQEQQLLRQENERLQAEVRSVKGDLLQSREKVRQLDATVSSLKQHKQGPSSVMKTLEQENISLKQELEAQKELNKDCEAAQKHPELEGLQQENEALKAQMTRLSTQLLEAFQAQLVGLLPPSPHRVPRGQHRGDDPDNMQQDDREKKMKNMEERMKEIELSLHNVKLLLREKVSQLQVQLHKNGKADVLIKDLYVENSQLLKTLELTEQRHKIAEKKNYLLEEKISSLNKIVRDLNPAPYHYSCS